MPDVSVASPPAPSRPSPPRRRRRTARVLVAAVAVVGLVAAAVVGLRAWWHDGSLAARFDPGCAAGGFTVSTDQAVIAADLVAVVISRDLPARAATLVLTAALQESKLRNVPAGAGDRDSVGVLQQRPSQGWGSAEQLADPTFAAGAFLDKLVQVPDWQTVPAAEAIQTVQVSVDGTLYAEHEPEAQALADALDGTAPAGLSCRFTAPSTVAPAQTVADQVLQALPVATPRVAGRTVTVPGAGWPTAAWFVANADRLGIDTVAHADRSWTRAGGWAAATGGGATGDGEVVATMAGGPSS